MSKLLLDTNKLEEALTSEQQEPMGSSRKQRVSKWDLQPKIDGRGGESDSLSKRRKTRWSDDSPLKMPGPVPSPAFVKKLLEADLDPEVQELQRNFLKINQRILEVEANGDTSMGRNSPSSPVYDDFGIKIDSGDANFHEKLIQVRQNIIARLIKKNPTFKPPSDKNPQKLHKRLYIPVRQFPAYNFIGLIIGPRGNSLKRMEKETGARIMLRGKGSRHAGNQQGNPNHDEEDLHVLIEAENQKSLDDAAGIVEKLLVPVVDGLNEHKRAQLRELADLNGKDENLCNCGQVKHMKYACPSLNSVSPCDIFCSTCGGSTHSTVNCPLTVSIPSGDLTNQQKRSFVADIGGAGGFTFSTSQTSCNNSCQGANTGFGNSPAYGSYFQVGAGSTPTAGGMCSKEVDFINLVVRNLPQTLDDVRLRELFAPFGRLIDVNVVKCELTGSSRGFGFVKYDNPSNAMAAVLRMNGYKIDGKPILVKVAGSPAMAVVSSTSSDPWNWTTPMESQDSTNPASWPGPPGSMLSDSQFPSSNSHDDTSSEQFSSSHRISLSSSSLLQFPGNPDFHKSEHTSYFSPPSMFSPQMHPNLSLSSSLLPSSWPPIPPPRSGTFYFP